DGKPIQSYRHADIISKDDAFGRKFVDLMEKFVTKLAKCFEYLAKEKSRACIFVYSEQEKNTIKDSLLKILSMDSNLVPSSVGHLAARCLFNLFEDSSLLLASRNSEINEIPELSGESSEFLRVIILEQAIRENIAIHVPGFYRLIDVWEQMVRPKLEDEQLLELLNEQAKNIDLEEIYSSWISSKCEEVIGLNKAHLLRNDFANAVIKVYYMLLKEYTDDISSKLLFAPSPFKFAEIRSFKNDYLGKIYFFKQYEAITESKQVRSGRFADYVSDEAKNGILLQLDKFINKSGSEWVMRFDVLSDGKVGSLLEKSNLKEFILVEDTMKGILEAIKFPDMKYRNTIFGFAFTVVSIHDIDYSNPDKKIINLKGYIKKSLNVGSKYRLYKRYVDFNLDKVLKVLSEIDECEESIFLQLLKDPNAWGAKKLICEDEDLKDIKKMALELRDSFLMSPSQKEFSASLLERRLQIVWGPPVIINGSVELQSTQRTNNGRGGPMDQDELLLKVNEKLSDMISQGTAALNSTVDVTEVEMMLSEEREREERIMRELGLQSPVGRRNKRFTNSPSSDYEYYSSLSDSGSYSAPETSYCEYGYGSNSGFASPTGYDTPLRYVGDVKGKNSVGSVSGDGEEEDTVRETAVGEVGGRENLLKRKSKNLDNKKHNKKVVIGKVVKDNEMVVIGVDVSRDGVIVEDTHVVDNYVNKRKSTTPLTAPITTTDTTTDITTNAITDTTTNTTANITTINITQTISKSIPSITFPSTSLSPPESESSSPSSLPSISIDEQKIILREFNHYYRLRMSDKSTTQWKIANEIRDISDVKIALAQSTVSKILSKNSMPKDTNTLNAIKKWVENEKNKTNNVIDILISLILHLQVLPRTFHLHHVVDNYVNKRKSTTPLTAPITTTDTTTDITTNAITDTTTNTTANITTINITQTISKSIPSITFPSTSLSPPESESSSPSSLPSISIEEQKIILREFNHYYRLRMSDKSTTQWKIANEIRDISDVKIALAQSTVSKILSKNSMPKDTNTLNAIKKWVENEKNNTNNVIDVE
ncbi:13391_t:CDS:2, partial [Entrophospora sp. SA101]